MYFYLIWLATFLQARPLMSHALEHEEFEGLADPTLEGNYVESEMFGMIEAAAACVRNSAAKRPRMGQVDSSSLLLFLSLFCFPRETYFSSNWQIVRAFGSFSDSDLTNGMSLGKSTAFDSAQQSLEIRALRRMQFVSQWYSREYSSKTAVTHWVAIS